MQTALTQIDYPKPSSFHLNFLDWKSFSFPYSPKPYNKVGYDSLIMGNPEP